MSTHASRSSTTSIVIPDRTVLRRQLEESRSAFHTVVESLTDADWHRKTSSTAWTIGEVLTHLADALAGTPEAIEHVRLGKNYPKSAIVPELARSPDQSQAGKTERPQPDSCIDSRPVRQSPYSDGSDS